MVDQLFLFTLMCLNFYMCAVELCSVKPSLVSFSEHVVDDGHELHDPLVQMEVF